MNRGFYNNLADRSLSGDILPDDVCRQILTSPEIELFPLLNAAYEIRRQFRGKEVSIHIINNAQNGYCPEDCHYCPQAKTSRADIVEYPLKPDQEILAEAKQAYERGAFRYCMVFAGRGPSQRRVEHLAKLIRDIKSQYPIEICVSTGLLDKDKAQVLKDAGLDRLNHNLNTSERHYPAICTTHTYADRLNTLNAAKNAGIEICSGMIVGMGETSEDVIEVAKTLRSLNAPSIPVNFLVPVEGNVLQQTSGLTPDYCLRVLCLYRFLNPQVELRVSAGRELHFRSLEALSLYPANSLFLGGYLNTRGATKRTLQMIKDAGFTIKSEQDLNELLKKEEEAAAVTMNNNASVLKGLQELRPQFQNANQQN